MWWTETGCWGRTLDTEWSVGLFSCYTAVIKIYEEEIWQLRSEHTLVHHRDNI